ncbi:MAG: nucleotide-binding universal stress UspA family protein [Saprospiraceae bacterium]|jgi:nucleotide-binding universal stress UspA family protein
MNILVPIDFTAPSIKAIHYAFETANALKAQVFFLHIISSKKKFESEDQRSKEIRQIEKEMTRLTRAYPNQAAGTHPAGLPVINLVSIGKVEEMISSVCSTKKIDLIILGTRDKHNPVDYLLGSVSSTLIQLTPCPMIIVPEKTPVEAIRNIAIATDDEYIHPPLVTFVNELSEKLKARVEKVYIYPLPKDFSDKKEEVYNPTWMEDKVDPQAEMIIVRDPLVVRGLDYFIDKHQIDLLALYVPHRKGWEKYLHRSLSKRMIYHTHIPVLIWNHRIR